MSVRWAQDFMDCVAGVHGSWWQDRADEAMEQEVARPDGGNDGHNWQRWADVRQTETEPADD